MRSLNGIEYCQVAGGQTEEEQKTMLNSYICSGLTEAPLAERMTACQQLEKLLNEKQKEGADVTDLIKMTQERMLIIQSLQEETSPNLDLYH